MGDPRWPGPEYRIEVTFRAPLRFVYRWCTDYRRDDAAREGEKYTRRVVERTKGRVVFEDIEPDEAGWFWTRHVVRLIPPYRWHMDGWGNRRHVTADYRLAPVGKNRTRLELRWRRRPSLLKFTRIPKSVGERSSRLGWANFRRELERDYRRSRTHRR